MSIKAVAERQASRNQHGSRTEEVRKVIAKVKPPVQQRWSFSYRYFSEIKNFGLDSAKVDKKWALSVVYRLQELSKLTISEVFESRDVAEGTLRFHEIDWKSKNIPIKRADLDWIDKDYLNNSEEYPIMQIAVSKAEGRLVGFFDEQNAFQIVLFDPLHNAQPSNYNGYQVQLCQPLGCEITTLRYEAGKAIARIAERECGCAQDLDGALSWSKRRPGLALVIPSSDEGIFKDADELIEMGLAKGYEEIVRAGIDALLDTKARVQE